MAAGTPRVDLVLFARFLPNWSHIEPLRLYLEACTKARRKFDNAEGASIVLQELLENAVKYSLPSCPIEVEVYMLQSAGPIEIRVANHASPSRLAMLAQELRVAHGDTAHNAFAAALARLKTLPAGSSMVGLSRIATAATLESEVKSDRVTMIARVADRNG
jgi:hypothetical protein